jgi:hypothetical protein
MKPVPWRGVVAASHKATVFGCLIAMGGTKSNREGCLDWSGLAPSRTFNPARGFEYRQRTSSAMVQLVHDVVDRVPIGGGPGAGAIIV